MSYLKQTGRAIGSSLKSTVGELIAAIKHRSLTRFVNLFREGSPLEDLIDSILLPVFWVLVLAPVLLVPLYYLALSVMPK